MNRKRGLGRGLDALLGPLAGGVEKSGAVASPPANEAADGQLRMIPVDLIQRGMGARDQLAVVSFGQQTAVERPPQRGEFPGFTAQVGADASNLADALDSALALIPPDAPGRILVVSDGKWTGRDPLAAAARAAGRGIAMDHRLLARPSVNGSW